MSNALHQQYKMFVWLVPCIGRHIHQFDDLLVKKFVRIIETLLYVAYNDTFAVSMQ